MKKPLVFFFFVFFLLLKTILFMHIWSSSNTRGAIGILDLIEGSHIHTLDLQKRKNTFKCIEKKKKKKRIWYKD